MNDVALWIGYSVMVAAGLVAAGCAVYGAANFCWKQMGPAGRLAAIRVFRRQEYRKEKDHVELRK